MNMRSPSGRRVGILTYDYDPPIGGLGVLVRTYVQELRSLYPDDTFTVFSPAPGADDQGSPFGRARFRRSGGCPFFSLSLLWALPGFLKKNQIQILHVHSGSGGVFLLRKPDCRLIVTAHHTYRQEADLVYARQPLKKLWKLFMAILEARTYRLADAVVCVSKDTASEIITHYGVVSSKVSVIENPVNIKNAEELLGQTKKKDTIMFVGRLEPRKGVLLLLKALEILRHDMPSVTLRLIGSNLLGDTLETIIRKRGLQNNVTVLGYIHDPYRFRETVQATILVAPSTLEGFGLVAAEAMMLGTAVVSSDAPGLRSVVSDGRTGLTFPVGDARACAERMKKILTDDVFRTSLEKAARTEAIDRFDVKKRTQDHSKLYDRLLGN